MPVIPTWLDWAHRLQTIGQAGLTYSRDPFDRERFDQVQRIAAEIIAAHTGAALDPVRAALRFEQGYATPKVDVRAVVPDPSGRLLLVQEHDDHGWTCPGGWADLGEPPSSVAAREVLEEAGYEVTPRRLLAVYDKGRHPHPPQVWSIYKIFIECALIGGTRRTSHETLDARWFGPDELPPLSFDRLTDGQLRRMFELVADPSLPPDFD